MIVVSDTSPFSALLKTGHLSLLHQLYGEVIIPNAVFEELMALKERGYDVELRFKDEWIKVVRVKDTTMVNRLLQILDMGEAEAIILAKELNADLLLIDEKEGRAFAKSENLEIIGILGILLEAKRNNFILSVKQLLDDIVENGNFRLSRLLYEDTLRRADEF